MAHRGFDRDIANNLQPVDVGADRQLRAFLGIMPIMSKRFTPKPDEQDPELCIEVDGVFITLDEHGENYARKLWWHDFWVDSFGILFLIGFMFLGIWLIKG